MKLIFKVLGTLSIILLSACNANENPRLLLKDEANRKEIFKEIANDPELLTKFIEEMHDNDTAMTMMRQNMWMDSKNVSHEEMQMMGRNSEKMQHMMQRIIDDSIMTKDMMTHLHQKGIMSSECYQNCINNINTKKKP